MKIKNYTVIGFQCPYCGSVEKQVLRMFECSDGKEHSVRCEDCGRIVVWIERVGKGKYKLTLSCVECGAKHQYTLRAGELWNSGIKTLGCLQTDDTALIIGDADQVDAMLEDEFYDIDYDSEEESMNEFARLIGNIGSPVDLLSVLEHFKQLSDSGRISCACGETFAHLQIDDGGLLLCCPTCGRELYMDISTPEAVEKITKLSEIELT